MRAARLTRVAVTLPVLILAAATAGLTGASAAPGTDFLLGPETQVNGGSQLTACPFGASEDFAAAYDDAEVEPQVAVNPTNPNEMVGVTQQDRWPDGGARGLSSWMSLDRGLTWIKLPDAPWAACQGGPTRFGRVTDPWVSYDKAGNIYFIGQPIDSAALGISAISVTTFNRTLNEWAVPTIIQEDIGDRGVFNDKVSITGDPTRAGYAYATWLRADFPPGQNQSPTADFHSFAYRGQPMFSRTTDGGATWSKPVPMRKSNAFFQATRSRWVPTARCTTSPRICSPGQVSSPTTRASTWVSCARTTPVCTGRRRPRSLPFARLNCSCRTTTRLSGRRTFCPTSRPTRRTATST